MGGKTAGKRGVGQPRKYGEQATVVLTVTAPQDLIDRLDAEVALRRDRGDRVSRSSVVVELLTAGLGYRRVPPPG